MASSLVFYFVGVLLLVHSGYSSFEFHKLTVLSHYSGSLPVDIVAEAVVGILIIVIGSISSIKNLPVLSLKGEKVYHKSTYLKFIEMKNAVTVAEKVGLSDYDELKNRVGFINIVNKRKEYTEWLASGQTKA
ncbi:hypothetical protein G9P44_002214 [Scheffersomyces stipitis]|nr:hypothetical protein G9P44_002214 [Scheffersomyces stipitis]